MAGELILIKVDSPDKPSPYATVRLRPLDIDE
jgi:hypothetical protein